MHHNIVITVLGYLIANCEETRLIRYMSLFMTIGDYISVHQTCAEGQHIIDINEVLFRSRHHVILHDKTIKEVTLMPYKVSFMLSETPSCDYTGQKN